MHDNKTETTCMYRPRNQKEKPRRTNQDIPMGTMGCVRVFSNSKLVIISGKKEYSHMKAVI